MSRPAVARVVEGDGPIVAAAMHDGHAVRPEVGELLALSEAERLREEDPFTGGGCSRSGRRRRRHH